MYNRIYKSEKTKSPAFVDIITRSGIFSGLSFKLNKEKDIRKSNYLSSVPNISFSFDYTKAIFDYSESKNESDKSLVKAIFSLMKPGTNFSVSQCSFLIEDDATAADLSGTYNFVKYYNNIVVAEPVSVTNLNSRITIYQNKYFKSIPQIGTSSNPKDGFLRYTITNSLLSEKNISFINFGIYPNDIIKISGTLYNDKIFKVLSIIKNSDGSETLIVENEVKDEVSFGNPIIVDLVQSGPFHLNISEKAIDNVVGSCSMTLKDGSIVCYSHHNENQCSIRAAFESASTFTWTQGAMCQSEVAREGIVAQSGIPSRVSVSSRILTARRSLSTATSQATNVAI